MAIYKRGKTWWINITSPNGQRIRRSTGTQERKQALEFHDQLKAELWKIHKLGDKPRRTWQETVIRWTKEKNHKADHIKDISKLRWFNDYFGNLYLDQINRDLIDHISDIKKQESSPSTANRYLALIRAILRMARDEWEWIDRAPRVRLYPEPKKRIRWITPEEAKRLIKELPPHLADMASFSLATGLRQRNVSYLRWDQVNLDNEIAWIHADQSKSGKSIKVPLNFDAISILNKRIGQHDTYIFTYQDKPVDRTSTKAWKAALSRSGIDNFRWHDLRHTWASWHVQSGTSLQELQELGGWATFDMVLRYAHLGGNHLKTAASRIEGTILSQKKNKDVTKSRQE